MSQNTPPSNAAPAQLATVLAHIQALAKQAGRNPDDVKLMAVSKTKPSAQIVPVLAAGHRLFGENRVQEGEDKWPSLKTMYPDVTLALIGPLQSNKARAAVQVFDRIDSVDRDKIARTLSRVMKEEARLLPCLVQINTGDEPQKAGIAPHDADAFIARCKGEYGLPIVGVQAIPPVDDHPGPHFALLKAIAERNGLPEISMGMSGDYADAIALGATTIRLGTAIFGARTPTA